MGLRPRIDRPSPAHMDKSRPGDSERHLTLVRQLPCAVTGISGPSDPHHLMRAVPVEHRKRGKSVTNEDRWTIPLSRAVHRQLHDDKRQDDELFLMERGVDARRLAQALWDVRDEGLEAYERVILRHAQDRLTRLRDAMRANSEDAA